ITVGVTHRGARDPLGGYPGRLQRRVGPQVRVLNRGLAGTTTAFWLTDPSSEDGRRTWRGLLQLWPDLPRAGPPPGAQRLTPAPRRGDESHPSEEGYEILAAILTEELATRGYLPGAPSSTTSTSPARSAAPSPGGSGTPAAATSPAKRR